MKKIVILLSVIAICLVGCETYTLDSSTEIAEETGVSFASDTIERVNEETEILLKLNDSSTPSDDIEGASEKSSNKHHHEMGELFSFQPRKSTAMSHVRPFCKKCNQSFGYTLFRGTPEDTSYLEVIEGYSDVCEIVGGEYYTITAIVALADYDFAKTRIRCKVESENIIVNFPVEFRDEFEDEVDLLQEGDEVVFRGRFYEEGCGWTDCELIEKQRG